MTIKMKGTIFTVSLFFISSISCAEIICYDDGLGNIHHGNFYY